MPKSWQIALMSYRYPVDLSAFVDSSQYPQWFSFSLKTGSVAETMAFEEHFRLNSATALEAWFEVVFWKMFSQKSYRSAKQTKHLIDFVAKHNFRASFLNRLCHNFVQEPTRESFGLLHSSLGYSPSSMAITATFPAFMDPKEFPMVDTRVAKWVHCCGAIHNSADPNSPRLLDPGEFNSNRANLRMSDFAFYRSWIDWCRYTARKISFWTQSEWRARDVEMAIFYAWGDKKPHPGFQLNPLPAIPEIE
jgi:hypothetical protein